MELDLTCWRGMRIAHPAQWELSLSNGPDDPGHCVFSDRTYERLDVHWRPLKYVPDLDLMLSRHRVKQSKDEKVDLSDLTDVPEPWRGVVRAGDGGVVVHAGRFFRPERLLVEATMVWPADQMRDGDIESAILSAIVPQDMQAPLRRWRAAGLDLTVESGYELTRADIRVGRIGWTFQPRGKNKTKEELTIERFAMPGAWLKSSLRDWLADDIPEGHKLLRQDPLTVNAHRGQEVLTRRGLGVVHSLRRLKQVRAAAAWICPVEERLYRVAQTRTTKDEAVSLPDHLRVTCCQARAAVLTGEAGT